jgi:hypothetical protein
VARSPGRLQQFETRIARIARILRMTPRVAKALRRHAPGRSSKRHSPVFSGTSLTRREGLCVSAVSASPRQEKGSSWNSGKRGKLGTPWTPLCGGARALRNRWKLPSLPLPCCFSRRSIAVSRERCLCDGHFVANLRPTAAASRKCPKDQENSRLELRICQTGRAFQVRAHS